MKAIVTSRYGTPDVLRLEEVERPMPANDEVLVEVKAAAVNPLDWHILIGLLPVRFVLGLFKPKYKVLGANLAGIVQEVGKSINQFQPGDEVYGNSFSSGLGAFAEYVKVIEDNLIKKPKNLTFAEAAAVPTAALTALNALRWFGYPKSGQHILINGASGGVGTYAVQLAKALGTRVTGVCSTGNLQLVTSLGADHVIDYTKEDFTQSGRKYDLIIDNVGNLSMATCKGLMTPNGNCAIVGFNGLSQLFSAAILGGKRIKMVDVKTTQDDLLFLNEFLESGKMKSIIDRQYELKDTAEALWYVGKRHAKGKVVITMPESDIERL